MRAFYRGVVLLSLFLLMASCAGRQVADPDVLRDQIKVKVGDLELAYSGSSGAEISYHGIPFSQGSSLWVVAPGWGEHYYGPDMNPMIMRNARVRRIEGGKQLIVNHSMPLKEYDPAILGQEVFTLYDDNTLTFHIEFEYRKDVPAIYEWGVGRLYDAALKGMTYHVDYYDGKSVDGVIPYEAEDGAIDKSTLARGFKEFNVESRFGPVSIGATENSRLMIMDYRRNRWADPRFPIFWFGNYEGELKTGDKVSKTVTFKFPEHVAPSVYTTDGWDGEVPLAALQKARTVDSSRKAIVPAPKEMAESDERFMLTPSTRIYLGENPTPGSEKAARFFLRDLNNLYKTNLEVVRGPLPAMIPKGSIVMGEEDRVPVAAQACRAAGLEIPENDEGYALFSTADHVFVSARKERGVFYGATTLVQLLGVSSDGVFVQGMSIRDWPSMAFRGVHALSGNGDDIAQAVRDLMARYKMNYFVWETEYVVWDACPELAHPKYAMSKREAQKVVDAADENLVEIVPLIQSLGHSEWVFSNGQNMDLAEDPDFPYATMVANPRTYEFLFKVYEEAIDFFHPRYFHIGHDEVRMRGRYPFRSASEGDAVDLFLRDVETQREWFAERGIRIMMWGDMALLPGDATDATNARSQEEAMRMRNGLNKDIVITDWHYEPVAPEQFTSLKIWKDLGFDVIGSGWYTPGNIANLSKACADNGIWGYLQTTWAGFVFRIRGNEEAWHQYWAYILAGQYSWTGVNTPEPDLPFKAKERFLDAFFPKMPLLRDENGFAVDLRPAANRSLVDNEEHTGWLAYGPDRDFSLLPSGELALGQTKFLVQQNAEGNSVILLPGIFNPPGEYPASVTMTFEPAMADEMHFLMCVAFRAPENTTVGAIELLYADGSKATLPLVYGSNIFTPSDERIGTDARVAWDGRTAQGEKLRLWDLEWKNPHPGKGIKGVGISSTGTPAAPVLFAVTGASSEE